MHIMNISPRIILPFDRCKIAINIIMVIRWGLLLLTVYLGVPFYQKLLVYLPLAISGVLSFKYPHNCILHDKLCNFFCSHYAFDF